ncbi:MAG TPA: SGNH/GDSL hydrolase family protein, partial [Trebonia sp.]
MTHRNHGQAAGITAALITCCLLLSCWIAARVHADRAARTVSAVLLLPHRPAPTETGPRRSDDMITVSSPLGACEARLEHQARRIPTVAVVGASYTAGTGPGNPELSWAVRLARQLDWNAVIDGVPGAGYVRSGSGGRGPMAHLLTRERLRLLRPALVVVQAGHDDLGVPPAVERRRVTATVHQIRAQVPGARIALLTTFSSSPRGSPALRQTDRAIVAGGLAAAPGAIVIDPLAGRWRYARARDGL